MQSIIHFTDSFSKVCSIIESSSLRLKYCQEDFLLGTEKISRAAHPMVCFSKYDLDQLPKMEVTYGRYGIAFSDHWANKNRIHQVLYFDKESVLAEALAKLLKARRNQDSELPRNLRLPIMQIKCFTKNAQGYNSALGIDNFNFAAENEWRFVPNKKDIGNGLISQNLSAYLKKPDKHNQRLLPFSLKFTKEDVLKIFVSTQEEVNRLTDVGFSEGTISVSKWTTLSNL